MCCVWLKKNVKKERTENTSCVAVCGCFCVCFCFDWWQFVFVIDVVCWLLMDLTDRQRWASVVCVVCWWSFLFLFFFILWNELMNFVEDGKKGGKEKQESDWLQQKMFFVDCCWIDWLILFFWNGLKRKDFLIVFNLWINWF